MCLKNMTVNNKRTGNAVEQEFAEMMYDKGWWVHILSDKVTGQPFDCIMANAEVTFFVDIKSVESQDYLLHSRIEDNQRNAFKMLTKRKVKNCGFMCKFNDGWYYLPFEKINFENKKTHKRDMIKL